MYIINPNCLISHLHILLHFDVSTVQKSNVSGCKSGLALLWSSPRGTVCGYTLSTLCLWGRSRVGGDRVGGTFEKECMESGVGFCTCATVNARGLDPNSSLRCCTDMCCYTYTRFTKWKSGWIIWDHGKYILMYSIWKHLLCCAGNIKIQSFPTSYVWTNVSPSSREFD